MIAPTSESWLSSSLKVWQYLSRHPPELHHRIAHGGDAKGDAPAAARLELLQMRDAVARRTVGQPAFQTLLAVIGRIVEIEKTLGVGERRGLVIVHVDVVVEDIVEPRHVAAGIAADLQDKIPRALESFRADGMGHPAVGDLADAAERQLRTAGIRLSLCQPLGVGRQPDRT